MDTGEIILYTASDGTTVLDVRLEQDTIWINRQQMAELFDRDIKTIGKHINNALNEELKDISVVAKFATTASDGKTYQVEYYNIEMITSVGYRVKSRRGTQFRTWANKILKEYLIKGYAVKENIKLEQYEDLKQTIRVLANVLAHKTLEYPEATGLLRVITDYTYALDTLDRYDYQKLFTRVLRRKRLYYSIWLLKITRSVMATNGLQHFYSSGLWSGTVFCTMLMVRNASATTRW